MFDQMRKQSQSAIMILLFGFIIFVFVFSFGAGSRGFRQGRGCGYSNVVATVNGEEIPEANYTFFLDQQMRRATQGREENRKLRPEEKKQIQEETLNTLVDQALLEQGARRLGLLVSEKERNVAIRSLSQFQDENKRFDYKRYKLMIQRYYQTTPALFEKIMLDEMLSSRMAEIIQDTARVLDDELMQTFVLRESKVDLEFAKVPASLYSKDIKPTDAEIEEFEKNNTVKLQEAYENRSELYHKPKQAQVAHVFFEIRKEYDAAQTNDKKEKAEISLDDIKKGTDFALEAKEYSEDDTTKESSGELPMMNREKMTARFGSEFAEAAISLSEGQLSPVVKSEKGFHVLKCLKVIPAEDHLFDEVKKDLARELVIQDIANHKAQEEAQRLLNELRAGKKLSSLVPAAPATGKAEPASESSTLVSDRTGLFSRSGRFVPKIGVNEDLFALSFQLTMDHPVPEKVIELDKSDSLKSYVVFALAEKKEADLSAFPKEKEALRAQMLSSRRYRQLSAWLADARKDAKVKVNEKMLSQLQHGRKGIQRSSPDDDY
jgi:peptidyl-prolyl cis-trans isomerase D